MSQFIDEVTKEDDTIPVDSTKNETIVPSPDFDYLFTTKPLGKGKGLGLSISRQIVEQRPAGTLTCTSTPGKGSKFEIALPLC